MALDLTQFHTVTRDARKVLVVDLGFLGDAVHLIPACWELRRHYPQAELHTLSAEVGQEVLAMVPCVDCAWGFPLTPESPSWWRHWDILQALRREKFDVVYNLSGADRSVFVTAFTGARWRVARMGGRWHFWSRWWIPHWSPRSAPELPVYEQHRAALAACGLSLEAPRFDLRVPAAAIEQAREKVPDGALHFSINASSSLKEWPLTHWTDLARLVLEQDRSRRIVATGSAREREQSRLAELAAAVHHPRLLVLPPGLTVAGLAAVLRRCSLHVGGDSGVLHLAMALGVPTVALFRDYPDARAWIPQGPAHRVFTRRCACVQGPTGSCAVTGVSACLSGIDPEEVAAAVMVTSKA